MERNKCSSMVNIRFIVDDRRGRRRRRASPAGVVMLVAGTVFDRR